MTDVAERPPAVSPSDEPQPPAKRRSIITSIATAATRRWQVALGLLAVVIALGVYAFTVGLSREGFPPIDTPISVVTGQYFVDDAELVDAEVVRPLEEAFRSVDGVAETTATSQSNFFAVVVEFTDGINSIEGTELLRDLDVAVPEGAQVDYRAVEAAKFVDEYDLLVSIVGPEGVTAAELEAQGAAVEAYLQDDGEVERAEVRSLLTELPNPATGEVEQRLTRFTRVALDSTGYQDAIAIGVVRPEASDLDVLEFSDRIDALLAEAPVAEGFDAEITADFAFGVRQQLNSLTGSLRTGLIAVALVSLLLIGWRVSIVTATFMGLVLLGALVGLWAIGFTLNTITLFGLILTLGLLVDDAIVISESIDANRNEPDPGEDERSVGVVRTAINRVGSASFAGTLTTVMVFSPMLFIGGILGEFIRPIPTTVIVTLLMSFVFSIVFIPVMSRLFLLRGGEPANPIIRFEQLLARGAARLAGFPAGRGAAGFGIGLVLASVAIVAIGVGVSLAGGLGFSIFPAGKDAVGMTVIAEFPPGTTIEDAQAISDEIDDVVIGVLGDELQRAQYVRGNERTTFTFMDLSPIGSRDTTAPEFVAQIEAGVADIEGARITVSQAENGPPAEQFPFATQIDIGTDPSAEMIEAASTLAADIQAALQGREFDVGTNTVTVLDTLNSTEGAVARRDGSRYFEIRAQYDNNDAITSNLTTTEEFLAAEFGAAELESRGLEADALAFDFGLESDNQDDFAALGTAGIVALIGVLLLIIIQFRSVAQSLLIFLAIPFSFFGVFSILTATDNPLSFLVSVGFIALIGVAVNNTILLVDAANQARRAGATAGEAITDAIKRRFRPLVATTLTTVAGLLPLSLSDPFWESLGFTLIGGLVSSTILVLISFPAFYLGLEAVRTPVRNFGRKALGWDPIT